MSSASRRPQLTSVFLAGVLFFSLDMAPGRSDAAWPDPPRADPHGDPLPDGARFRFGSLRYRQPFGITSSALSPDEKYLAAAGNGHVAVWELATGRRVHFFRDCGTPRFPGEAQVTFSPDGKHLTHVCAFDVAARVWDLTSGKLARELGRRSAKDAPVVRKGPIIKGRYGSRTDPGGGLRYSPDGKELLVFGNSRLALFNPNNETPPVRVSLPASPAAFSPDGKRCAALFDDDGRRTVLICSTESGKEEARIAFPHREKEEWHVVCAFAPDGKTLATAEHHQGVIRLWDLAGLKERRRFQIPPPDGLLGPFLLSILRFASDGQALFVGTQDGDIYRLDLTTGKALPPLKGHALAVTGLHFARDGKTLVSTSADATVRRWDLVRGVEIPPPAGYAGVVCMAFAPDGKRAAVGDLAGRLDLWDAATGRLLRTLRAAGAGIQKLAFAPDGKALAAGCRDGVVRLLDPDTGKETAALPLPNDRNPAAGRELTCLAFSPDGGRLLTNSRHDGLRLWEWASGKSLWNAGLAKHHRAAFSPDGKWVAAVGWDAQLTCRVADTGNEAFRVPVLPDPQRGVEQPPVPGALAFSPDGKVLASGQHDGSIRFWDPASGRELKRLWGHAREVCAVRFSPDGRWLVSAGSDGTVRIWEVITAREVRKLVGPDGGVVEADFSPDARTVLAAGTAEALVWDVFAGPPAAGDVAALWEGLRSTDAVKAFAAGCVLAGRGKEASALLRGKIAPVRREDPRQFAGWIAALDNPRYAVRESATKAIAERGDAATPALREALKKPSSPEARRRLEFLLNPLHREPTPEEVLRSRAIQVLEMAATPEARQVLQEWAAGIDGSGLTEEARAALGRLKRRGIR